ncbi:LysM peptidoglycan-binding domain-containing protein [Staphylococcus chromogenes]|uniref:LysM peptidoglycan-binding domain-containing protein n=1 Tax=Staphylococcus chromogenes TaxID=46126 RepID=UPI000D0412B8|nr:LysM peptidoglycan-binding domain-containing protein [Staphylococcus chromogenes]
MKKFAFALTFTSGAAALLVHQDAEASTQHTVQSGESIWSIAQQYGVSVDQLTQDNNLSNHIIFPGQVLTIGSSNENNSQNSTAPQLSQGQTHTVRAGESLDIIAAQYGVTAQDIMNANQLNGYLIFPNQTLTIPGGSGGNSTTISGSPSGTTTPDSGYTSPTFNHQNLYDWGQCTWHVFNKRAEAGQPISTYWWNADHWAANAAADGYTVDHNPTVGSIMQNYEGPVGHVAYVEQVNPDGSILISEMNYNTPPGTPDYRTIPASIASSYNYIH